MKKIFLFVIALFILANCYGCGKPSPSKVTEDYLKSIKANPAVLYENQSSDISSIDLDSEAAKMEIKMLQSFDYSIGEETVNEDKAKVKVEITTYDMSEFMANLVSQYITKAFAAAFSGEQYTDEQYEQMIYDIALEQLKAVEEKGKTYTVTVSVNLTKDNEEWSVDPLSNNSDLANAITGNLLGSFDSISALFSEFN